MKFFAWLGMSFVASFFAWFTYFGFLFVYADASGRKAAFGFESPNSDLAATIIIPIFLTIVSVIASAKIVEEMN